MALLLFFDRNKDFFQNKCLLQMENKAFIVIAGEWAYLFFTQIITQGFSILYIFLLRVETVPRLIAALAAWQTQWPASSFLPCYKCHVMKSIGVIRRFLSLCYFSPQTTCFIRYISTSTAGVSTKITSQEVIQLGNEALRICMVK